MRESEREERDRVREGGERGEREREREKERKRKEENVESIRRENRVKQSRIKRDAED